MRTPYPNIVSEIQSLSLDVYIIATNKQHPEFQRLYTEGKNNHIKIHPTKSLVDSRTIQESAFEGCNYIASVRFPDILTTIGNQSFLNCIGLSSVDLSNTKLTNIQDNAFKGSGIVDILFPDSLNYIGSSVFEDCKKLQNVDLSKTKIKQVSMDMCTKCISLTSVNLPNTLIRIRAYAFKGCKRLTNIQLPKSDLTFGDNAFEDCSSLQTIDFNRSVNNLGNLIIVSAYFGVKFDIRTIEGTMESVYKIVRTVRTYNQNGQRLN